MTLLLVVWLVAAAAILVRALSRRSVGLIPAYVGNLWIIHWLGASAYAFEGWSHINDPRQVERGFELCTYGLLAVAAGIEFRCRLGTPAAPAHEMTSREVRRLHSFTRLGMALGFVSYFVLLPLLAGVPTMTAVISCGLTLFTTCVTLRAWAAWRTGAPRLALRWVAVLGGLPLLTMAAQGFLGFGTLNLVTALAFLTREVRRRAVAIVMGALLAYGGLSFYVSYMRDRNEIRAVVWGGRDIFDRAESIGGIFLGTVPFDWTDPAHLRRLDERLNQNALVGAADEYIGRGRASYGLGRTLLQAVLALVPRALWPDKPFGAGSMGVVTEYTGIRFARNTSVGVGVVLELFINFGVPGVVIGFFLLGYLLAALEGLATARLERRDWPGFLLVYMPAISLLQVGGMFLEVTATAAGSYLLVRALIALDARRQRSLQEVRSPAPPPPGPRRSVAT